MAINGMEHMGFVIPNPRKTAEWCCENLGFTLLRQCPNNSVAFIKSSDGLILELIAQGKCRPASADLTDPLQVHLCLKSNDYDKDVEKLIKSGAKFLVECPVPHPAKVCIIEDPYGGLFIQLACRKEDFFL